jgi:hypothetical protein
MKKVLIATLIVLSLIAIACTQEEGPKSSPGPKAGQTAAPTQTPDQAMSGIRRTLSKTTVSPGEEFEYMLRVMPDDKTTYWLFNDAFPSEVVYISSSKGSFNEKSYDFKEVEINNMSEMEFRVDLKAPEEPGQYMWSGRYYFEGDEDGEPIGGQSYIEVK